MYRMKTMPWFLLLFRAIYMYEALTVRQPDTVVTAHLGESVTLNCTFSHDTKNMFWYKQRPGEILQVMVVAHVLSGSEFKNEFSELDYSIQKEDGVFHLTIKNLSFSDEASYFCATSELSKIVFGNGTFLTLSEHRNHRLDLKTQMQIQTSVPDPVIYSSDPKMLDCTVLTESRTDKLSVFWFRPTSGGSRPVSIYMEKNCSSVAESSSHTQSCVYRLPVELSSDSGTFYCAVASYGQLLFGNGGKTNTNIRAASQIPLGTQSTSQGGEEEMVSYAALQFTGGRSKKKRGPPQDSVYSDTTSSRS